MKKEVDHTQTENSGVGWLYRVSGAAALLVGVLLMVGIISLVAEVLRSGASTGWLASIGNNWLITIFKLHAGFSGIHVDALHGVDALDLVLLALVAVMYLGLYAALRQTSRSWSIVAAVQPFLGIVLFLATQTAGRSAVMGAGLVISLVMLRSHSFSKATGWTGIIATILLLVGDFTAGVLPPLAIRAALVAAGYILLIAWFAMVGAGMWQLGAGAVREPIQS